MYLVRTWLYGTVIMVSCLAVVNVNSSRNYYVMFILHTIFAASSAKKLGGIWRQKTQKAKNKGHATMRLRHGEKIDADEIAETFVNNELDNVDAPPALQATTEEIRGLTTSMSIKKAVRCVTPLEAIQYRCTGADIELWRT